MGERRPPEIVFFDLETNVPVRTGQGFSVLEFGAIIVCPRKLVELESFCTLIRPADLTVVPVRSWRSQGITRAKVAKAPVFEEVADEIFRVLNGRIWAGHNIQRFDCVRIREAFAEINQPAPTPAGIIDSLGILTERFGRRAGNMKMATLAAYFGLGEQKHRSLEDVRMNLEVLKHCATVLFLESTLPPSVITSQQWQNIPSVITRSRSLHQQSNNSLPIRGREEAGRKSEPSTSGPANRRAFPYARETLGKMTNRMKNMLSSRPLDNLLRHSQSLIR